ncbi:DUF4232 domain-containing protein [Streptomyces sp. NPDC059176]|uniref:DUF4232 domain-containing protein n=1 Tax=unclassified Streptomyces TaxID=2593676 RepID=UPI0036890906
MSRPYRVRTGITAVSALAAAATAAPVMAASPAVAAPPPPCATSALGLSWGPGGSAVPGGSVPGSRQSAVVALSNLSRTTCMLDGFPKMTLVQGAATTTSAGRTSAPHSTVTLEPGTTARFTLAFTAGRAGRSGVVEPSVAVVTPPNNTGAKDLHWRWGPVATEGTAPLVGPVRG